MNELKGHSNTRRVGRSGKRARSLNRPLPSGNGTTTPGDAVEQSLGVLQRHGISSLAFSQRLHPLTLLAGDHTRVTKGNVDMSTERHEASVPYEDVRHTSATIPAASDSISATSLSSKGEVSCTTNNASITTYACVAEFTPNQVPPALRILQYLKLNKMLDGDSTVYQVPEELMTSELVEIRDGWGWCLIGVCGITRYKERVTSIESVDGREGDVDLASTSANGRGNPWSRRRADMLYDHIRVIHLRYRPLWCTTCLKRFSHQCNLDQHMTVH